MCVYTVNEYISMLSGSNTDPFAHQEALEILYICKLFTILIKTKSTGAYEVFPSQLIVWKVMVFALILSAAVMELDSSWFWGEKNL